ncbi:DUF3653 domain-containing protein [Grimontia celer]|uniref:DUF3653 domain-containing protein n=1 Tax=Grimontia celer TaxID=1796497 RepID=UPI0009EF1BD6
MLITPDGREFHPYELVTFPIWKSEYYALREKFGRISSAPMRPARAPVTVYRGPKRTAHAPWVPNRIR